MNGESTSMVWPTLESRTAKEQNWCIRYEAMIGVAKCRKWGGLLWLGGTQGHEQCSHLIDRIGLPI